MTRTRRGASTRRWGRRRRRARPRRRRSGISSHLGPSRLISAHLGTGELVVVGRRRRRGGGGGRGRRRRGAASRTRAARPAPSPPAPRTGRPRRRQQRRCARGRAGGRRGGAGRHAAERLHLLPLPAARARQLVARAGGRVGARTGCGPGSTADCVGSEDEWGVGGRAAAAECRRLLARPRGRPNGARCDPPTRPLVVMGWRR